jgi:hypothetical protein
MMRLISLILKVGLIEPVKYGKKKVRNGAEKVANIYFYIREEKEDRAFWNSRGLISGRVWDDVGRKLNAAIREGAYETKREVEQATNAVGEVLAEVDEAEQMMRSAGVVIVDAREGKPGEGGRIGGGRTRISNGKEKLKSGMLKLKAWKWMSKGVRGAEHRREAWLHRSKEEIDGEVMLIRAENGVWDGMSERDDGYDREGREQRSYQELERPVEILSDRKIIEIGPDEIEMVEGLRIHGLGRDIDYSEVESRMQRAMTVRDYVQEGIDRGAIVQKQIQRDGVEKDGAEDQGNFFDSLIGKRVVLNVGRRREKKAATEMVHEVLIVYGYDAEQVDGAILYRKRLG